MRTPGIYSNIKVATQRNQLPNQAHKIIFINTDVPKEIPPTDIFDTAEADAKARPQSNAGRMMAAALMVSQGVNVEMATWTRRREDIKCDYKETFSMPFNADGTVTVNLYYNHKSHLQTASMTIRQDSASTSYEFLGGAVPGDKEDIVGCSLLAGRVVNGMAEFTIYGFSKDARFDDGKFDAVEVLLELRPLLTRKMVRIDEKFEFVDVIPAASAGMTSSEGDVYPHLSEPLVNSCCELVIPSGAGGGGGGSDDNSGGSNDNSGGGNTTPTMQHFFAGHPGYYFEDPNNDMLSFEAAKAKGLSRVPIWIETGMQQFTERMDLSLVDNYEIEHTGYVEVSISSPNNANHYIGPISGLTHEQLIKGAERTPEMMYHPKKWKAKGEYYAVDTWAMSLSFEYRVSYTVKSTGEFVEVLNMGNADYITIREKAVAV